MMPCWQPEKAILNLKICSKNISELPPITLHTIEGLHEAFPIPAERLLQHRSERSGHATRSRGYRT